MVSLNESCVDVLVLGAGPAGVMCGNALARAGVNVRIIDKRRASFVVSSTLAHVTIPALSESLPGKQTEYNREPWKSFRLVNVSSQPKFVLIGVELWPCRSSFQQGGIDGHGRQCNVFLTFGRNQSPNRHSTIQVQKELRSGLSDA